MKEGRQFSCFVIGSGTLPIRCAEILLSKGHVILGVISSDLELRRWAREKELTCLEPIANLKTLVQGQPFDYLFSIVNEHIVAEDVLKLPRKLAINYHDAPLPKYAGTHATSWALMNGETDHGITWHVVSDVVDAGDILKQQRVEITENDTALTLNTKCYEAAINSFTSLIDELACGSTESKKQNLSKRSFYPRFKRPDNGCVISWNQPACKISALVRALDFGPHPNPLGSPKLALEGDFVVPQKIEVLNSASQTPPGTITKIGPDFLQVSTADRDAVLDSLLTLDGRAISIPELVARFALHEGYRLADLDSEVTKRLEELDASARKHEAFWVQRLISLEPAVLPYPNSARSSGAANYASVTMRMPEEILGPWANQPGSKGNLLLAAYGALLARLGGVDVLDIGYSDPEIQSEVAGLERLFETHLPLSMNVDCSQSFTALLKDVNKQIESVKKHVTYAHDLVRRYPQLHSVCRSSKLTLPVVFEEVERLDEHKIPRGSEITLLISEDESECRWVYDTERFAEESIAKLAHHFTTLLRGVTANPELQIAYLPLLAEDERHKLLGEWNDNHTDYPKDQCIHQLFEAQVARTPDSVALIFGEQHLTYRELNSQANQLAHYLRSLGVGPEVLVGICLDRSVEMIVGVLGILKAGGAYVPMDPVYPRERLALMLEDSQVSVLLTQQKLVAGLGGHHAQILCLDTDWNRIAQEPEENPVSVTTSNNLAYVIYTSGSTGKPKGVAIEHRSTVAFLSWAMSVFTRDQLKGTLASTSICFDLSVYEMFAPLCCGGAVILVENVLHLPTTPAANEVSLINTVPSAITELLRIKGIPSSVRTVNLAGEPLKTDLVRQIYELGSVRQVIDLYGPTEDTTYSTFTLRQGHGTATIGRPISNTQAYILDRGLQPVPTGLPGELYLGGDGLARGYLNRPELTDERFVANPFSNDRAARLYRTGDLARYLPTGEIEYLGRIDNQVKIRGYRIELGEVEAAISAYPTVRESVVTAREDRPGEKRLVAYVVSDREQAGKINELRQYLKEQLPDFMVPSAFVELDELPLTPNGKVNRKALPAPTSTLSQTERTFVPHRDQVESQLANIWEEILGVHPIGVTDNFFDLGGHSLQAVRMFAEVETTFGKSIPLATLLQSPTIAELAQILRQDNWTAPESSLVPIQPNGSKPPFFCIHAKGGNVLFYRDLARYLGDDQPLYGLQARRLGGRQVGHSTVEEMAEFYIKEIQTLQPDGPYFLGGSSFGGLAAFEIAQQLHAQGHKVALLALLDTGTPDYPRLLPSTTLLRAKVYNFVQTIQQHRDSLKLLDAQAKVAYVLEKAEKVRRKYYRKFNNSYRKAGRKFYTALKQPIPENFIQVEDKIWRAGQKYVPRVYPGKVTLFRARIQPSGIYRDPTLGWEGLAAGGLEIHEVPGHHGSLVKEPFVSILAAELRRYIERAIETTGQTQPTVSQFNPTEAYADSNLGPHRAGSREVGSPRSSWASLGL